MDRKTRRTWGIIAVLAIVALVGWGLYEAADEEVEPGADIGEDDVIEEDEDMINDTDIVNEAEEPELV